MNIRELGNRVVSWIWSSGWTAFAIIVIFTALMFSTLRLALPYADGYRNDLEFALSEMLNVDVEIHEMDLEWKALGPRIVAKEVYVYDPEQSESLLGFDALYLDVNLFGAIFSGNIAFNNITLVGLDLDISADTNGNWQLQGIQNNNAAPVATDSPSVTVSSNTSADTADDVSELEIEPEVEEIDPAVRLLLGTDRINLISSDLHVHMPQSEDFVVQNVSFSITNDGEKHTILAKMDLPPRLGTSFEAGITAFGDETNISRWSGTVYYGAKNIHSQALINQFAPNFTHKVQGEMDFNFWGAWHAGNLVKVDTQLTARNLLIQNAANKIFLATKFETDFSLLKEPNNWQAQLRKLNYENPNGSYSSNNIRLNIEAPESVDRAIRVQGEALNLASVSNVLRLFEVVDLPTELKQITSTLDGELRDFQFVFQQQTSETGNTSLQATGTTHQLSFAATENIPGIQKLDAGFELINDGINLRFQQANFVTDLRPLFREPLQLQNVSGETRISWKDSQLQIEAFDLLVENDHVSTNSDLYWYSHLQQQADPFLFIRTKINRANGNYTSLYLPAGIMGEDSVDWLDRSIKSGTVPGGDFVFFGHPGAFPYYQHQGRFYVGFDVRNALLRFLPSWPAAKNINAYVEFEGPGMYIQSDSADFLDIQGAQATATIKDLDAPYLAITAEGESSLQDSIEIITDTPLKEDYGLFANGLEATGTVRQELQIDIELDKDEKTTLLYDVFFDQNNLYMRHADLHIKNIRGPLRITDTDVKSRGLKARMYNSPVFIKAKTNRNKNKTRTQIDVNGNLQWKEVLPASIAKHVQGKSRVDASIIIPPPVSNKRLAPITIYAVSDLQGTAIKVPQPFTKQTDAKAKTQLKTTIDTFNGEIETTVRLSDRLQLKTESLSTSRSTNLNRVLVALGKGVELPDTVSTRGKGIFLRGRLNQTVDLQPWIAWLGGSSNGSTGNKLPLSGAVSFKKPVMGEYKLPATHLQFESLKKSSWRVSVNNELMNGDLTVPHQPGENTPYLINMSYLHSDLIENLYQQNPDAAKDKLEVPPVEIHIKKLETKEAELDDVVFSVFQSGESIQVKKMDFDNPHMKFRARGLWKNRKDAEEKGAKSQTLAQKAGLNRDHTYINIQIQSDNYGKALERLGVINTLKDGKGTISASLDWPGAPYSGDVNFLHGEMSMDLKNGELLAVDPGVGRFIGLLSIQTLPRRLFLDFSDVGAQGFEFDSIGGSFRFVDGNAYTHDLTLDGPIGNVVTQGRTGLVKQDFDQTMTISLKIGDTLPVVGALSGGTQAGIAVLLLQQVAKVLGGDIDAAARFTYNLNGSWDNPQFALVENE